MPVPYAAAAPGNGNGIGSPDVQCQAEGFDFGIAKWEWNKDADEFELSSEGEKAGYETSVTGDDEEAEWSSTPGAAGIIVKAGNNQEVRDGGTSGTEEGVEGRAGNSNNIKIFGISHITLCGNDGDLEISEEPKEKINAILECVVDNGDDSYTAHFSYETDNEMDVTIAVGPNNKFTGGGSSDEDRGQTTLFEYPAPNHPEDREGRTGFYPDNAFSVDFDGSELVWTLKGPDGATRTATASSTSKACPVDVTPVEPLVLTSMCTYADGGAQWRVRNSQNDFDVDFTWEIYNNQETGGPITATNGPAFEAGDTFFDSTMTGTMKIYWEDENGAQQETTKATNSNLCPEPEPSVLINKYVCEEGTSISNVHKLQSDGSYEVPPTCQPQQGAIFGYVEETTKSTGQTTGPWLREPIAFQDTTDEDGVLGFFGLDTTHRYGIVELDEFGNEMDQANILYFECEDDGGKTTDAYEFAFPEEDATKNCLAYNLQPPITQQTNLLTVCKEDEQEARLDGWTVFVAEQACIADERSDSFVNTEITDSQGTYDTDVQAGFDALEVSYTSDSTGVTVTATVPADFDDGSDDNVAFTFDANGDGEANFQVSYHADEDNHFAGNYWGYQTVTSGSWSGWLDMPSDITATQVEANEYQVHIPAHYFACGDFRFGVAGSLTSTQINSGQNVYFTFPADFSWGENWVSSEDYYHTGFDSSIALSQEAFNTLNPESGMTEGQECEVFEVDEGETVFVGEVMQLGWEHVSGGGQVTVDQDMTVTLVNKQLPPLTCTQAKNTGYIDWTFDDEGTATVTNNGYETYMFSLASYEKLDLTVQIPLQQVLFDSETVEIAPGESYTFEISVPACAYQIDLVCDDVIVSFEEEGLYGDKKLSWAHPNDSAGACEADAQEEGALQITKFTCPVGVESISSEYHIDTEGNFLPHPGCTLTEDVQFGLVAETDKPVGDTSSPWARGPIAVSGMTDENGELLFSGLSTTHRYGVVELDGEGEPVNPENILYFQCQDDPSNNVDEYEFAFAENDVTKQCVTYNAAPADGQETDVCELGVFHLDVESSGVSFLSTVDLTDGATSGIATYQEQFRSAVAISADGTIYSMTRSGSNTGDLVTLNDDGTFGPVGATGLSGNTVAMSFAPDGTLYAMNANTNGLFSVDTVSGAATLVHTFAPGVDGGDFVVNEYNYLIYVKANGNVYQVDLEDGYATVQIGNLPAGSYTSAALYEGTYYAMDRNQDRLYSFELSPFSSDLIGSEGIFSFGDATACPPEARDRPELETSSTVLMCKADQFGNDLEGWQLLLIGDAPVATLDVTPFGDTFSVDLPEGDYVVVAEGKYTYRPTAGARYSDAAFSQRLTTDSMYIEVGPTFETWVRLFERTELLSLQVNGVAVNWGELFSQDHLYAYGVAHAGGELDFRIQDNRYNDNSGSINVRIYEGYAGWTGQDGCFELADVADGEYVVDEINHQGWDVISGLGPVTIDGDATITVVNENPVPPATSLDEGSLQVIKYTCPEGTEIVRNSAAAPDENGAHQAPPECTLTEGVRFGVIHDETNTGTSGPFIGLDDDATWTFKGETQADGTTLISGLSTKGRYGVAELDESNEPVSHDKVIAFFCYGDPGTFTDNWDMTFIQDGDTSHCIMYNVEEDEGPGDGDTSSTNGLIIHKYACEHHVTTTRGANGPAANGDHTVPADCEELKGVEFGYIFQDGVTGTSAPYPGYSDGATFNSLGKTNENGKIQVEDLNTDGRYNIAEIRADGTRLGDDDIIGFYCIGDKGTSTDNYEFTFVPEDGFTHCVAYNKKQLNPGKFQVCKAIVDNQGTFLDDWSDLPDATFSMDVTIGENQETWSTDTTKEPYVIAQQNGADVYAHCIVLKEFDDVTEAITVSYGQEMIASEVDWKAPVYNDLFGAVLHDLDVYGTSPHADGTAFISKIHVDSKVLIVNQLDLPLDSSEDPVCVDTAMSDEREADEVISADQGDRKGGSAVPAARSVPEAALTFTAGENEQNFFSLGFGGEIVVRFDEPFGDGPGADLVVIEDTWGGNYPAETVEVFVSQDGTSWTSVGFGNNADQATTHTHNEFDLNGSGLAWAQYVKIVDTTDASLHNNQADGFDINGIKALYDYEEVCTTGNGNHGDNIPSDPETSDEDDSPKGDDSPRGSNPDETFASQSIQQTSGGNQLMNCDSHPWLPFCNGIEPEVEEVSASDSSNEQSESPSPATESSDSSSDAEESSETQQTTTVGPTGMASSLFDGVPSGAGALLAVLLLLGLLGLGFAAFRKP